MWTDTALTKEKLPPPGSKEVCFIGHTYVMGFQERGNYYLKEKVQVLNSPHELHLVMSAFLKAFTLELA